MEGSKIERRKPFNWIMIALLIVFTVVSIFTGVNDLSIGNVFSLTDTQRLILLTTRLPRTTLVCPNLPS